MKQNLYTGNEEEDRVVDFPEADLTELEEIDQVLQDIENGYLLPIIEELNPRFSTPSKGEPTFSRVNVAFGVIGRRC